ncbi:MAG: glycosyltransferase family A protein [Pirellulaceae bacterium]|nr:glycosyltransferase family A protein [Pirellulaceae bacterium]
MIAPAMGVVVPVYNRAQTVLAALDSIANQTARPRRLVVVDDGSRDDSADSVERWIAARRPEFEVRVIRQANGGAASARNRGFAEVTDCPWVAFLDSDDQWPAGFLSRAASALHTGSLPVAMSANRRFVDVHSGAEEYYKLDKIAENPTQWMLRHGAALLSCTVLRTELVRELGGFPQNIRAGEDSALLLPLSLRGPWRHLPGRAVTFQRMLMPNGTEEGALSRKYRDNKYQWALVYDRFIRELSAADRARVGTGREVTKLLANRWLQAGDELAAHGLAREAARCYARAVYWRPTKLSYWQTMARTQWTALTRRAVAAA